MWKLSDPQLPDLIESAKHTSETFPRQFCSSCGQPEHEGRCEGPPGPPSPPTRCPFCGEQRGANPICCDTQEQILGAWQARAQLESWARTNVLELAELVSKRESK